MIPSPPPATATLGPGIHGSSCCNHESMMHDSLAQVRFDSQFPISPHPFYYIGFVTKAKRIGERVLLIGSELTNDSPNSNYFIGVSKTEHFTNRYVRTNCVFLKFPCCSMIVDSSVLTPPTNLSPCSFETHRWHRVRNGWIKLTIACVLCVWMGTPQKERYLFERGINVLLDFCIRCSLFLYNGHVFFVSF